MGERNQNSALKMYSNDIKNFKLLTGENEKKLLKETSNGNIKSRNELITSNLGLVLKIASKYRNLGVEIDELICEGNKGLIIAANNFNPSFDNKFSTYAYFWIKQCILAEINENKKFTCLSTYNVLNNEDYIEKDMVVNMNEFEEDKDSKIKDIIRMIDGLPNRERVIVKHYFGVNGYSELDTVELSKKFNISAMRVSNIIESSIRKIRCGVLENE